jgi:hypothetical protein
MAMFNKVSSNYNANMSIHMLGYILYAVPDYVSVNGNRNLLNIKFIDKF